MLGPTAIQLILVLLQLLILVALRALLFLCWINCAHQAESIAEVARLNLGLIAKHNGYFFEYNDFVIKHNGMKNRELWNNILSQFLSIMYRCLVPSKGISTVVSSN